MTLTFSQKLKLNIFEHGITITPTAERSLSANGNRQIIMRDYVTTGGLTIVLEDTIFVNCPVGDWFCDQPAGILDVSSDGNFILHAEDHCLPVRTLPLPAYLTDLENVPPGVMTHGDRVRLSPIEGCACSCKFCDWPLRKYHLQKPEDQLKILPIACSDTLLSSRHVLVSGGTPRCEDESWLEQFYYKVIAASSFPVDVMLMPRNDPSIIDRLFHAGVYGFSINLEIFNSAIAAKLCQSKSRLGRASYEDTISRAVALTGGNGRVRSLLLVGQEPAKSTLAGVEFIASLGADPVLSPFRPAQGTTLASVRPPSADFMEDIYLSSIEIANSYNVKLGPRCIPCMHNTITFPDGSPDYFYS